MILWIGTGQEYKELVVEIHPQMLISFFYKNLLDPFIPYFDYGKPGSMQFILDSGAFSARNSGKDIDLDEYCAFIHSTIKYWDHYVNLDVIPGTGGREITEAEINRAATLGWENYQYMKADGLDPMPVYHYGEPRKWLHTMLDAGCDYIGLGGMVGLVADGRKKWLDSVFRDLTDVHGNVLVKTHGFGMTSVPLMLRYPWYSVDSISWKILTINGYVDVPRLDDNGKFRFDVPSRTFTMSQQHSHFKQQGKHATHAGITDKEVIERWLEHCGVTWDEAATDYTSRARCNLILYSSFAKYKKEAGVVSASFVQESFFD